MLKKENKGAENLKTRTPKRTGKTEMGYDKLFKEAQMTAFEETGKKN